MVRPDHRSIRPSLALGAATVVSCAALISQPGLAYAQDAEMPTDQPIVVAATSEDGPAVMEGLESQAIANQVAQDNTPTDIQTDTQIAAQNEEASAVSYDKNAVLYSPDQQTTYAGVYTTKIGPNQRTTDNPETIGMPSIADTNLADAPTTESPAIIQGAAVGYEEKTGATEYTKIKDRDAPYSEFMYSILEEKGQDGTVHKKLSGFDGTYVIVRLDVSSMFTNATDYDAESCYLHVKQDDNRALLVAIGMTNNTFVGTTTTASGDYKAGGIYKTGSYKWSDMLDAAGLDRTVPYLDIIVFATAANVAGADAGKEGALNGDIPLHFYVDNTATYNDTVYDPQSTDPNHIANCLNKFYDATAAAASGISNFLLKGSDLALETMVEDSGGANKDTGTTYWSLHKSMEHAYYDQEIDKSPNDPNCGRTVKLMSEVAIIDSLDLKGADANNLKKRTLDVNSFDVQVAKNSASDGTGFTIENAWMTIADKSNTTGSEVAIGNNAKMVIGQGGKLIIDETCQLEVEWDGGTTTGLPTDTLNNGSIDLRAGGELVNNGVISIEGTEGKPYQPGQQAPAEKGYGEFTILPGATLTNNGAIIANGRLYNLGTLVNNGKYGDVIVSNDPDKGSFSYHRGIQVGWKDDVTQPGVMMGELHNGQDRNGTTFLDALLRNLGDIVLVPGKLINYGTIINGEGAHIYLATATEAVIPIEPDPSNPTVTHKRVELVPPVSSVVENYGTIINDGEIVPASVELLDNGGLGALTVPGDHPELFNLINHGTIINNGFIWGWGTTTRGTSATRGMPATIDLVSPWTLGTLAVAGLIAAGVMLALRFRRPRLFRA